MFKGFQRRIIGWLAIVAMLGSALVPSVSHAMASGSASGGMGQAICSAQTDPAASAPKGGERSAPGEAVEHAQHCPCCVTHFAAWAPAPDTARRLCAPEAAPLVTRTPATPACGRNLWLAPHSRAPPAHA